MDQICSFHINTATRTARLDELFSRNFVIRLGLPNVYILFKAYFEIDKP